MALWENLKKKLPLKAIYVEPPFMKCDVEVQDILISDSSVHFKLHSDDEGDFTVGGNRRYIGIIPGDGCLRIEGFGSWFMDIKSNNEV